MRRLKRRGSLSATSERSKHAVSGRGTARAGLGAAVPAGKRIRSPPPHVLCAARPCRVLSAQGVLAAPYAASGAACARQHGCAGLPRRCRNLYGGGNGENAPASGVSRLRASRARRHYRPVLRRIQRHAPRCAHGGARRCVFLRGGQESRSMIFPAASRSSTTVPCGTSFRTVAGISSVGAVR